MTKLIVVTGITGKQGSSVARTFLKDPEWKVRGTTRNPDSGVAKEWASKGVEMVSGHQEDVESLKAAFEGAAVIFGLTDFWTPVFDPNTYNKLKEGQTITEYAQDLEVKYGKNLADAASATKGLQRYIYSTVPGSSEYGGNYKNLLHFDSKAAIMKYIHTELPELSKITSEVQLSVYYELWSWPGSVTAPKQAEDGKYYISEYYDGSKPLAMTATDDTGRCVRALIDYKPGTILSANSEVLTWQQYLKTFWEVKGVPYGGVNALGLEGFEAGLGKPLGTELAENFAILPEVREWIVKNGPKTVMAEDLGIEMTSWRDYCKKADFSAIGL